MMLVILQVDILDRIIEVLAIDIDSPNVLVISPSKRLQSWAARNYSILNDLG